MDAQMLAIAIEASKNIVELSLPTIKKYLSTSVQNKSLALTLYLENAENMELLTICKKEYEDGTLDKMSLVKKLSGKLSIEKISTAFFEKGLGTMYLSIDKSKKLAFTKALVAVKCGIEDFKDVCNEPLYLEKINGNHPEMKVKHLLDKVSELDKHLSKFI